MHFDTQGFMIEFVPSNHVLLSSISQVSEANVQSAFNIVKHINSLCICFLVVSSLTLDNIRYQSYIYIMQHETSLGRTVI